MSLLDRILNRTPEMIYSAIWQPKELETDYTGYEQPQAETQTPRKGVSWEALTGLKEKIKQVPTALENAIFGKQEAPEITTNADGTKAVTVNNNRNGGVLGFVNDFREGFGENLTTPYSSENLLPQKKSLGERLGEGLGTATRFLDSPLGRGLAVAGAVGALGGSGGDALAYGLGTTAQNQGLRMQDRIYRNDLKQHEINSLMASPEFALMDTDTKKAALLAIEEKYNNMGGYINNDAYKNILASRQMQENAEWRKANLMADLKQNEALNDIRRQDLAIKKAKLEADKNKVDKKELARAKQANSTVNMINRALKTVEDNPDAFGFSKGVLPSDAVDRLDPKGTEARAIINSVTAEYRKYLTGAQMSDKERQYYEKFLPNPRDNAKITTQKLNGMLMVISAREGLNTEEVGTITTNNAQPKTNDLPNVEATTIRVKSPNGKIGTIPATQLEDALAAGYTRL